MSKHYDYNEMQRLIEKTHERASIGTLGDMKVNLLIKQNAWLFSEILNKELSMYGLHCGSYIVLMTLYSTPENLAHPSDICTYTGQTRANMTHICDQLVKQGWLTRMDNPKDRRQVDLSLTEKGICLLEKVVPAIHERVKCILSQLDDAEKVLLENLLLKLMLILENLHL